MIGAVSFIYNQLRITSRDLELLESTDFAPRKPVSLALLTQKKEFRIGEAIKVWVVLESSTKRTTGVDVILRYEPTSLELSSLEGKGKLDTSSSRFSSFPYFKHDAPKGMLIFSALAEPRQELSGQLEVGILTFKALKKGAGAIRFDFERGSHTDSNVAYLGKDILAKVYDAKFEIR